MFRIFYAESDATLYEGVNTSSERSYMNTGIDEILEVGKRLDDAGARYLKSRSLVKFSSAEILAAVSKYGINLSQCKFLLQLYTTHAKNLPSQYTIDAKVVAQPWINGTGFENGTSIKTDGVSWAVPAISWSLDNQVGNQWISSSQHIQINNSTLSVSGSGQGGSWLYQSGSVGVFNSTNFNQTFFTQPGLTTSEQFSYRPTDINMDVTGAVRLWLSGSGGNEIENNGFLLKLSDADELSDSVTGVIRFFSRETHTIYVPKLVLLWDNTVYNTGSIPQVNIESYSVYTDVKPHYKDTEVAKIRIYSRDKYPQKSPTNLYPYAAVKALPETTYYAVYDAYTDEAIIGYDDIYSKVSCDSTSNYIHIDMNGFMPERYYRLEFKIVDGFTEQYVSDRIYFKVVR